MPTVTVSSKYRVVIPKEIRDSMGIQPGEKVQIFQHGDRIELVPVKEMKKMRGFLNGIDTTVNRDKNRA